MKTRHVYCPFWICGLAFLLIQMPGWARGQAEDASPTKPADTTVSPQTTEDTEEPPAAPPIAEKPCTSVDSEEPEARARVEPGKYGKSGPEEQLESQPDGEHESVRKWGFGTRFGVGYLGGGLVDDSGSYSLTGTGFKLELPTLDFRYFFKSDNSLEISWGIVDTVLFAALAGAFYMDPYISYSFNFGKEGTRYGVAPGLRGAMGVGNGKVVGALQVPVNLSVEFLTSGRGFGFQIFARPFFQVQPGDPTVVGGGVMGGVAFFGYSTT